MFTKQRLCHQIKGIYRVIFILTLLVIIGGTSFAQTCKDLPDNFQSYNQAMKAIKSASFKTTDRLSYGKSSWIANAVYFSCDGNTGFFVYSTFKGKEYIHEKVPYRVWIEFKNANSIGSYYNQNIRGRFRLIPE